VEGGGSSRQITPTDPTALDRARFLPFATAKPARIDRTTLRALASVLSFNAVGIINGCS